MVTMKEVLFVQIKHIRLILSDFEALRKHLKDLTFEMNLPVMEAGRRNQC